MSWTYIIIIGLAPLLLIIVRQIFVTSKKFRQPKLKQHKRLQTDEDRPSWLDKFPDLSEATIDHKTEKRFRRPPNVSMPSDGSQGSYEGSNHLPAYETSARETLPKRIANKLSRLFRKKKTYNLPAPPSVLDSLDKMLADPVEYDDVCLGLSSPAIVTPGQNFVIRFSAYLEQQEQHVQALLQQLSPADRHILNVDSFQWKRDTEISVRVYSEFLNAVQDTQSFTWRGKHKILNFDVQAANDAPVGKHVDIKVDVMIAGIVVGKLRLGLKIDTEASSDLASVKGKPYQSAFASYARNDTDLVKHRLSEIERNGVKIFWDRFSLHTGEKWQPQLDAAIKDSEILLLFWSANAKASEWVEWEWKTALKYKGLDGIDPHPLQDPQTAPPPDELKQLHFDDKYLYFSKGKVPNSNSSM